MEGICEFRLESEKFLEASNGPFLGGAALDDRPRTLPTAEFAHEALFAVELWVNLDDREHTPRIARSPSLPLEGTSNEPYSGLRILEDLVFPESADAPACLLEPQCLVNVSLDVGAELLRPELGGAPRTDIVVRAAVPEAAVDEHCQPCTRKGDVRPSSWGAEVDPVSEAFRPEKTP